MRALSPRYGGITQPRGGALVACRAVLFAFEGTLDAHGLAWSERLHRLLLAEGVVVAPARFAPIFDAAARGLVGAVPPALPLRDTVDRLVSEAIRGLGLRDPGLVARVASRFVEQTQAGIRDQRALLSALADRYRLGIISNFYGNLISICDECGLRDLFGVIIDAADVGVRKPDPRIFRLAVDALGVEPADAVFVGASAAHDMAGAKAAGLPHIRVAPPADRAVPCCGSDRVVSALDELGSLLL